MTSCRPPISMIAYCFANCNMPISTTFIHDGVRGLQRVTERCFYNHCSTCPGRRVFMYVCTPAAFMLFNSNRPMLKLVLAYPSWQEPINDADGFQAQINGVLTVPRSPHEVKRPRSRILRHTTSQSILSSGVPAAAATDMCRCFK